MGDDRTLAPLSVPNYRRMWGAAVISHLGTFLQLTAAPWLMLELTRSPFQVSLVTAFLFLPRLVLTLPAGALADSIDRRTILISGNAAAATAVGTMAMLNSQGRLGPNLLLGLTLVLGASRAVVMPAFQTMVPDLVPRPLLPQAITLNSGAFNVARAVGPAIGGAMVAANQITAAFSLNALSYTAVIAALFTLPRDHVSLEGRPTRGVLSRTIIGMRFARFSPPIRTLLIVAGGFALTAASVQALVAPVAAELGVGGLGFGILWGMFGAGALIGVGTRELARLRLGRRMIPVGMMTFGAAGILFGLGPTPLLAAIGLLLAGICWVWVLITLNATVQVLSPSWVRSRVVSLYVVVVGIQPLGAVIAGILAEQIGSGGAVAVTTAGTLLGGAYALRLDIPILGSVSSPETAGLEVREELLGTNFVGPVTLIRTWRVPLEVAAEFTLLMDEARGIRRRTGAKDWQLYQDASDPEIFVESVVYGDWAEYLLQRTRLGANDLTTLGRLRDLAVEGFPELRRLTSVNRARASGPPMQDQG